MNEVTALAAPFAAGVLAACAETGGPLFAVLSVAALAAAFVLVLDQGQA